MVTDGNQHILGTFSQRCFQNHIGCGIISTTIKVRLQTKYVSTSCWFLEDWDTKVLLWPYKAAVSVNIGWANLTPQLLLCPRLSLQVFDL